MACTFNDFNCQVFSTSGWKIVIRAPRTGVSPAGSTQAQALRSPGTRGRAGWPEPPAPTFNGAETLPSSLPIPLLHPKPIP